MVHERLQGALLRELVAAGEVKHVGREHQEAPEHEHVDAPCNAVLEHLFWPSHPVITSEIRAPQLSKRSSGLPFRTSLLAFQT